MAVARGRSRGSGARVVADRAASNVRPQRGGVSPGRSGRLAPPDSKGTLCGAGHDTARRCRDDCNPRSRRKFRRDGVDRRRGAAVRDGRCIGGRGTVAVYRNEFDQFRHRHPQLNVEVGDLPAVRNSRNVAAQPTGTVTMLFTDIEGSTRLLERLGTDRYREALDLHRRLLRAAFEGHGGYEVDYEGDAFFVAFANAGDAAAAAAESQQALGAAEWAGGLPIRVRMGIHTGRPVVAPPKYVGLDVHKAARIMAAGHGGQVLLSAATAALLEGRVDVDSLGEHRLKDLLQPEPLYQLRVEGLAAEFPALKTLGNRPTNLPIQPNALIGRESDIAEVKALLCGPDVRLVTLTGPGGTGKTRLTLHVGAELLDEFPSGVFFVSLVAIRDPALVVPAIAQALAVRELPGEDLFETLAAYLEQKQMLLVLDNFEQVVDAGVDVAALLDRCRSVKLLVTSRERLRLSPERVFAVPALTVPDRATDVNAILANEAGALFVARATAAAPAFSLGDENASAVAAICNRLDGLPLAIELAAARMVSLTPEALLRRLDQR